MRDSDLLLQCHPGLLALHSESPDRETSEAKWKLFTHALACPDLDPADLRSADPADLSLLATLLVMARHKPGFLKKWEAWAFVASHYLNRQLNRTDPKREVEYANKI